jgi:hypothetical protein
MAVTANEGADIAGEQTMFIFQLAISGRSHEGVDIEGEQILCPCAPSAVAANEGVDITAGKPRIFTFQLAISGCSHEGVDIAGEQIIFISQLTMISGRSQQGRRHRSRGANNFYFPAHD